MIVFGCSAISMVSFDIHRMKGTRICTHPAYLETRAVYAIGRNEQVCSLQQSPVGVICMISVFEQNLLAECYNCLHYHCSVFLRAFAAKSSLQPAHTAGVGVKNITCCYRFALERLMQSNSQALVNSSD